MRTVGIRFVIKLLVSVCVIVFCTQIGRKLPTLAGLIAVMPLTGLIVLIWLALDNPGKFDLMTDYTKGALWGIVPSIFCFFLWPLCVFASNCPSGLCFVQALRYGLSQHLFISGCSTSSELASRLEYLRGFPFCEKTAKWGPRKTQGGLFLWNRK